MKDTECATVLPTAIDCPMMDTEYANALPTDMVCQMMDTEYAPDHSLLPLSVSTALRSSTADLYTQKGGA
jgi:hypothetical protein